MKNRDFQFSRTRKQLQQYKSQGKKTVIWKLSYKQIEVLKMMRIKFEPYLYKIKTTAILQYTKCQEFTLERDTL